VNSTSTPWSTANTCSNPNTSLPWCAPSWSTGWMRFILISSTWTPRSTWASCTWTRCRHIWWTGLTRVTSSCTGRCVVKLWIFWMRIPGSSTSRTIVTSTVCWLVGHQRQYRLLTRKNLFCHLQISHLLWNQRVTSYNCTPTRFRFHNLCKCQHICKMRYFKNKFHHWNKNRALLHGHVSQQLNLMR